jgi:hypothetical protein
MVSAVAHRECRRRKSHSVECGVTSTLIAALVAATADDVRAGERTIDATASGDPTS